MTLKRIEKTSNLLLKYSYLPISKLQDIEIVPCDYKKDNIPPETGWKPMDMISGFEKHYWLRTSFHTPEAVEGCRYLMKILSEGATGWDASNPQGILYLNGKMIQGLDINHFEVFLEPDQEYQLHLYLYTANITHAHKMILQLGLLDLDVEGLYYDVFTPYEALLVLNENTTEYKDTISVLEQTLNLLDLRKPHSEAFKKSIMVARAFIAEEFYGKLCTLKNKPTVHCIGHTHIDVEWKWARNQTREKIQRSFSTAKALMDDYPEYRFTLSQPELYRYLKEEAPEKYEQLKELVKQGRWEPEGAMWLECDCNLTGGESLIRQILHGKRFFKEEFGVDNKVLFLPDVFGYSAAMPQILKKTGVDYFVTSKISWNDTNIMPNDTFLWQGMDGSEILTYFITTKNAVKDHQLGKLGTYIGHIHASHILGCWDRYQQKSHNKNVLCTFGYGDGGGGPSREMLEKQRRLAKGLPGIPATKMNHLLPFLQEVEKEFYASCVKLNKTPKWVGELYLEFHRGTYTSVAKVKKANRMSELALQKAEALSYTDLNNGGSYDASGFYAIWRKVLHNQFHDILPGSSIKRVYDGTDADYEKIGAFCNDVIGGKLRSLSQNVATRGGLLVYNSLGFPRGGSITVDGQSVELTDTIPAFGYAVVAKPAANNAVTVKDLTAENRYYRMTLDEAGRIVSLLDKENGREVFRRGQCGNELQVFEDHPYNYDAWELSEYYKSVQYTLDTPAEIIPVTDGSRSGFRVSRSYLDSMIIQNIWLYSESRRIDFDTEIDWHEKDQILKAAFPLDVFTDRAAYDVQFGHVYRPTHSNTSWDQAKFEVCAHKWADLSENGYGVALLNDCKYGYSTEGNTLKLTMLKSSIHPDPNSDGEYADQGKHSFSYALLPHKGSVYDAGVIREAYCFNQPLDAIAVEEQGGILPERFSLVSCQESNVIVETVKRAEDTDDLIVRLYESFGSRGNATVCVADGFKQAFLCDMLENELEELPFDGKAVQLPIKNFEILTLKFKR